METSSEGYLSAGREAYARGDWHGAYESFSAAGPASGLEVEDLAALGSAAWWLGRVKENLEISEEVFRRLCDNGTPEQAAMKALELGLLWVTRGDLTVGSGWISRARRLLRELPEGPEHGYLLYLDAVLELEFSGVSPSSDSVTRLYELGRRFSEPALTSLGLVLGGLSDLRRGNTAEGFAQLDEAMLPVLADKIRLEWVGDIYCTVIHMCHELADFRRMRAWTEATERWCARFGNEVMYTGVCRVHRLELLSIEGAWAEVASQIERASAELSDKNPWAAGEGFYQLGEIRRLRGDPAGALAAYDQARHLGVEPQPGRALLEFAAGRAEAAYEELMAAANGRDRVARARLLETAVEMALRLDRRTEAEALCRELEATAEDFASAGFTAWARKARAVLLLAEDRPAEALAALQAASTFFRGIRARHEVAWIHLWEARAYEALGQAQSAAWNAAAARAIFSELGARPELHPFAAPAAPGGLTPREVQVLGAVAGGASNREVADRFFISEKTVGRHLANIFGKIDVSSRTAAAAWARDHGVATGADHRR